MSQKDKAKYNAYMRQYMLERYHNRMAQAYELLGGKYIVCGSFEKLEIDHIRRDTKSFTIGKLWSVSDIKFKAELAKCQLLCNKHHNVKTLSDLGQKNARRNHGTLSSYRYCRCNLCRKAKSDWNRAYKCKNSGANAEVDEASSF
jgi:hypothetical protein